MGRVAQVRTQADLAMALGDLRLLTMSFALYWVADLAVGCLFPLRWLLRLVGIAGTWRACSGLGYLTPGFAAAAHTTLVVLALRCIGFVLPVVPPFVFVGVIITWQWLLLGALRDLLRQARPGLAAQAHILRWIYAVLAVLAWIGIGGAVGVVLAVLLLAGKWLWVVAT